MLQINLQEHFFMVLITAIKMGCLVCQGGVVLTSGARCRECRPILTLYRGMVRHKGSWVPS